MYTGLDAASIADRKLAAPCGQWSGTHQEDAQEPAQKATSNGEADEQAVPGASIDF